MPRTVIVASAPSAAWPALPPETLWISAVAVRLVARLSVLWAAALTDTFALSAAARLRYRWWAVETFPAAVSATLRAKERR